MCSKCFQRLQADGNVSIKEKQRENFQEIG